MVVRASAGLGGTVQGGLTDPFRSSSVTTVFVFYIPKLFNMHWWLKKKLKREHEKKN